MNLQTFESIRNALAFDGDISSMGAVVALTFDNTKDRQLKCNMADFPIRIYPFGDSQTASAGNLNLNGYFAITVTYPELERMASRGGDFLAIGERIVSLLHRSRHAGQSVIFSKNIIAHSSFVLENSNRRINVKVAENEMVQVLFFWTSALSLADLANATGSTTTTSSTTSGRTISQLITSSDTTETDNTDAINAIVYSSELFP